MNYDPELAASQPWSNDACRGYVIAAMERCGFKPSDIEQVMVELYEVFDYTTLQVNGITSSRRSSRPNPQAESAKRRPFALCTFALSR